MVDIKQKEDGKHIRWVEKGLKMPNEFNWILSRFLYVAVHHERAKQYPWYRSSDSCVPFSFIVGTRNSISHFSRIIATNLFLVLSVSSHRLYFNGVFILGDIYQAEEELPTISINHLRFVWVLLWDLDLLLQSGRIIFIGTGIGIETWFEYRELATQQQP